MACVARGAWHLWQWEYGMNGKGSAACVTRGSQEEGEEGSREVEKGHAHVVHHAVRVCLNPESYSDTSIHKATD